MEINSFYTSHKPLPGNTCDFDLLCFKNYLTWRKKVFVSIVFLFELQD